MNKLFTGVAASLALGFFLAPMVHADEAALNAQQLGLMDRALKFCGLVDPVLSKKLEAKVAELLKGASADTVAKARNSADYKNAYAMMDGFIAQVDEHNAKKLCAESADK